MNVMNTNCNVPHARIHIHIYTRHLYTPPFNVMNEVYFEHAVRMQRAIENFQKYLGNFPLYIRTEC